MLFPPFEFGTSLPSAKLSQNGSTYYIKMEGKWMNSDEHGTVGPRINGRGGSALVDAMAHVPSGHIWSHRNFVAPQDVANTTWKWPPILRHGHSCWACLLCSCNARICKQWLDAIPTMLINASLFFLATHAARLRRKPS